MKKFLAESELARDERFVRTKIEDRIFDPRGAKLALRNTGPAKMAIDRPVGGRAVPFVDARHLRRRDPGARRRRSHLLTTSTIDDAPFQLKLDMARQCWDESRHCEISIKLGDHMGTEIGEYTESTFLFAAACNPDPVLRLCGVNRALEGPRHRRLQLDEGVRQRVGRPGARVLRRLDARRRGHPREDGLRLAAPAHRQGPGAPRARARVPAHGRLGLQPRRLPRRGRREPDPARPSLP